MATGTSSQRSRTAAQTSSVVESMLPNELVAEIFKRLPVKSVLRFKLVCKDWLTMLSDPSFVYGHLYCAKKKPSVLIVPTPSQMQRGYNSETLSIAFYRYNPAASEKPMEMISEHAVPDKAVNIYLLAHCDGLLVIDTISNIYACNPATRELVTLPAAVATGAHGVRELQAFARACGAIPMSLCLGCDARSGLYKVFRTFNSPRNCKYYAYVEVLTLGADELSWRGLPGFSWNILHKSITSVGGTVYWLMKYDINDQTPTAVLCLDISTERLTSVSIPPVDWIVEQTVVNSLLAEVQGKLCLLRITLSGDQRNLIQVWFMSDSPASRTWTRYCTFRLDNSMTICWPILVRHGSDELILLRRRDDLCSYDRRSNKAKSVVHTRDLVDSCPITNRIAYHTFVESIFTESLVAVIPK